MAGRAIVAVSLSHQLTLPRDRSSKRTTGLADSLKFVE